MTFWTLCVGTKGGSSIRLPAGTVNYAGGRVKLLRN
jgi:hypothetical protein